MLESKIKNCCESFNITPHRYPQSEEEFEEYLNQYQSDLDVSKNVFFLNILIFS